ncbi:quinoprotein glucose dehydrogenase [Halogeometricum pallidum JCM 14848]|uniref:Quinoprotein glucose dehydrogenase n=1 Tax=Halogeometricum pallidum JCM 14848 TaxID=1227487 RepID=M0CZ41_HALPD|nr:PQQ-dependent sugar dehydrogenase [Halogeometricum pallidum]ELZ27159.1 quinoprotein glucose dehydrogenase [Halogeometricum pallidum JCM 14848]
MNRRTFLGGVAGSAAVGGLLNWRTEWGVQRPQTSLIDDGPTVVLDPVATGLEQPVAFAPIPGRTGSYVADKLGMVYVHDGDDIRDEPLLDARDQLMELVSWEQGLLGFELHPDFENTRRYYVRYSAPRRPGTSADYDHTFVLSEFTATEDLMGTVPDSERTILEIPEYGRNHNAGAIEFGPDGYLYVAVGDGNNGGGDGGTGHANDWYLLNRGGNGQNVTDNLLGSILRIDVDVDGDEPYAVPPDNPLVGRDGLDEQYAWGFRNPYRMSFDGDDLYVGDVGEDKYEEINLVRRGGNYGWNVREGTRCFSNRLSIAALARVTGGERTYPACPTTTPAGEPLVDPVVCYPHSRDGEVFGSAVIAGYRYRGADVPELDGKYVFGDVLGSLFAATPTDREDEMWPMETVRATTPDGEPFRSPVLSFGRGGDGELYVLASTFEPGSGTVYRVRSSGN